MATKKPELTIFGSLAIPDTPAPKPMKPREFEQSLDKLGLSVYGSGRVLGMSLRQSQRFASGEAPVPRPIAKLINLMLQRKITVEDVTEAG